MEQGAVRSAPFHIETLCKTATIIEAAASSAACFFDQADVQALCVSQPWRQPAKTIQGTKIKDFNLSPMWV